jgi:hypothetical protein
MTHTHDGSRISGHTLGSDTECAVFSAADLENLRIHPFHGVTSGWGREPRTPQKSSGVRLTLHREWEQRENPGLSGGGGGIRTHETLSGLTVFKTAGVNRFPTPPFSIACSILTYGAFDDNQRRTTSAAMRIVKRCTPRAIGYATAHVRIPRSHALQE